MELRNISLEKRCVGEFLAEISSGAHRLVSRIFGSRFRRYTRRWRGGRCRRRSNACGWGWGRRGRAWIQVDVEVRGPSGSLSVDVLLGLSYFAILFDQAVGIGSQTWRLRRRRERGSLPLWT